jgi:Holliday junction resolvasome RuvABC DNA-binding subunit
MTSRTFEEYLRVNARPGDSIWCWRYTEARTALVGLGFKPAIAKTAVDAASAHVGRAPTLEVMIREALRQCARA